MKGWDLELIIGLDLRRKRILGRASFGTDELMDGCVRGKQYREVRVNGSLSVVSRYPFG